MFEVLKHRTYRHFFAAQVMSLVGTGMMTVALAVRQRLLRVDCNLSV